MTCQRAWVKLDPDLDKIEVIVLETRKQGYFVQLKSGMKTLISPNQLVRMIEAPQPQKVRVNFDKAHLPTHSQAVLDVHGYSVVEAQIAIDQFLTRQKRGSSAVIVFGKGTGILKKALTPYMKRHPQVANVYTDHLRAAFEITLKN